MALSVVLARNLIAKSVIGGALDADLKADAMDALTLAMSELNTDHCYEFQLTSTSLTSTAGTSDYTIPANLLKVYSVIWGADHALGYRSQRVDDTYRPDKSSSTPLSYNLFPAGSITKMRLLPTPAGAATIVTVNYYKRITVPTATAGSIDLPADFQYWAVYQGKANFLSDRSAPPMRVDRWQKRADLTLARMKWMDQQHPGEVVQFTPRHGGSGLPPGHMWNSIYDAYGY